MTALRKERGLSRASAASGIGMTERGLMMLENGQRCPTVRTLMDVCRFYGVSPDEMMGGWE